MSVGAEKWCLLRDYLVEMYSIELLEAEDVSALLWHGHTCMWEVDVNTVR